MLKTKESMKEVLDNELYQYRKWEDKLSLCKDDLIELMNLHKDIWADGVHLAGLGPGSMFRTDNICDLSPDNVYLGNCYGIWTNNISFFEDLKMKDRDTYDKVCRQYRNHLQMNLRSGQSNVYNDGFSWNKLSCAIESYMKTMNSIYDYPVPVNIELKSPALGNNSIIHCELWYKTNFGRRSVETSFLLDDRSPWFPQNFGKGVILTEKTVPNNYFNQEYSLVWTSGSVIIREPNKVHDMGTGKIARKAIVDRYVKHLKRTL